MSARIFKVAKFILVCIALPIVLLGCSVSKSRSIAAVNAELVAELDVTPGNMTISSSGRKFASIHGLRRSDVQLIEITGPSSWQPFPNKAWNRKPGSATNVLNSPLGVIVDHRDWLWVIDSGNFLPKPLTPKLLAFDIETGKVMFRFNFPQGLAPKGSLLQDLAISPDGKFVYIADSGGTSRPGIVVVNTATKASYRYDSMRKFEPEQLDLVVRGTTLTLKGKDGKLAPARLGINPITVSADGDLVFFGSMNGTSWYSVPAALLNSRAKRVDVNAAIKLVGAKPLSDGATTDTAGNHYFTSVTEDAIVKLGVNGELRTVVQDQQLEWPDSVRFGPDGWLYIAVNQLNRTAALNGGQANGGQDTGVAPYKIFRIPTESNGMIGR